MLSISVEGFGQSQNKFLRVNKPIPNKYIVVLNGNPLARSVIQPIAQNLAASYNGQVGFVYEKAIKGFSVEMSEEMAIALSKNSLVKYITEDAEMHVTETQYNAPWNLDRLDQRNLPLDTTYTYNSNGAGNVAVYIIDTGINGSHSEFGGPFSSRVIYGADFVGGNGGDCNGHGTHVAGSAGGTTYGVAKSVILYSVRVFGCSGNGSSSTVIAGINWVAANHATKSVANLSLGGGISQATDDAVRNLIASGVTSVVSAGNDNIDANNVSPARVREAITVGAVDINDNRASFSNFGNAVDIFAPGVDITSAGYNGGFAVMSGTSMAAPHVTGAVALYLQTNFISSFTPARIQDIIVSNASWSKVSNPGIGSPNTLLFVGNYIGSETLIPLYRYWSGVKTDHMYTSIWGEMGAGLGGYTIEGVEGYVSSTQSYGLVPLYRYYSNTQTDHLYTADFSEFGYGAYGFVYEGIVGYIYDNPQSGGLPLHRYSNSSIKDHFYTTNFSELGYGANGYVYEGVTGYLLQ